MEQAYAVCAEPADLTAVCSFDEALRGRLTEDAVVADLRQRQLLDHSSVGLVKVSDDRVARRLSPRFVASEPELCLKRNRGVAEVYKVAKPRLGCTCAGESIN